MKVLVGVNAPYVMLMNVKPVIVMTGLCATIVLLQKVQNEPIKLNVLTMLYSKKLTTMTATAVEERDYMVNVNWLKSLLMLQTMGLQTMMNISLD
jgi:hypothetical protein